MNSSNHCRGGLNDRIKLRRGLRLELLEARSLLAANLLDCDMTAGFEDAEDRNSPIEIVVSPAETHSPSGKEPQARLMFLAALDDEELEPEGEPPSGIPIENTLNQGQAGPAPSDLPRGAISPVENTGPAASVNLPIVATLGTGESVGPQLVSTSSTTLGTVSSTSQPTNLRPSTGLSSDSTPTLKLGQIAATEAGTSESLASFSVQTEIRFETINDAFQNSQLDDRSALIPPSQFLNSISQSYIRSHNEQILGALIERIDLSRELLFESDSTVPVREVKRTEADTQVQSAQSSGLESGSQGGAVLDSHDLVLADGMMTLDIPEDLLPHHSQRLAQQSNDQTWAAPIGIYRQGEVALANGAYAQSRSSHTHREDNSQQATLGSTEMLVLSLRPTIAASFVAIGAVLIGIRQQRVRDAEIEEQFRTLQ